MYYLYCLYGIVGGGGYRCWERKDHKPLSDQEIRDIQAGKQKMKGEHMMIEYLYDQMLREVPEHVWYKGDGEWRIWRMEKVGDRPDRNGI